jgi:hypothetical protein
MNIVKKIAVAAAFLCAATVANADDGMKIGARVSYSTQMLGAYDMGLLGVGAGVAINIPAGPIVVAPEVAFLYRTNFSYPSVTFDATTGMPKSEDLSQTEMAISIPVLVKWFPIEALYVQAGVQVDLPLNAKLGDEPMDGKEIEIAGVKTGVFNWERATIDLGIPVGVGYYVMPNLSVDARYVIGLLAHSKYKMANPLGALLGAAPIEIESDPLSSMSVGVTYFF